MKKSKKELNKYLNTEDLALAHAKGQFKKKHPINLAFNIFSKKVSDVVGSAWTFILALAIVAIFSLLVAKRFYVTS